MQLPNKIVISPAGSRKTTSIINEVLENLDSSKRTLILTYTIDNSNQIKKRLVTQIGAIPKNVIVRTWYEFLFKDGLQPYRNFIYEKCRVEGIVFVNERSTRYTKKEDIKYFIADEKFIYSDKISEFIIKCNSVSRNLVIKRLEAIYGSIYIDEVQDLAGYDFDLLEILFCSKIRMTAVGDNRQATYFTNPSPKNKKFKGHNIVALFKDWEKKGFCSIEYRKECYRSNQIICDFADRVYPSEEQTKSLNNHLTGHDGLFIVKPEDLRTYIDKYRPTILRYDAKTDTLGMESFNFGKSKGLEFDRVLIFPHGPIKKLFATGDFKHIEKSKSKFYVAITRAKYSVAFIHDNLTKLEEIKKFEI